MIGAIIGDIAGSRFEHHNRKTKDFDFFVEWDHATDDSVMTLAVARAILDCEGDWSRLAERTVVRMREMGRKYPYAGYGQAFRKWIAAENPQPYNSFGNGSAMRVSPVAWAAGSMEEAKEMSRVVTAVTHDHPEGIKGAEAVTVAIRMALDGEGKDAIRRVIREEYYDIDFSLDEIRDTYRWSSHCQGSVPQAIVAFLESESVEDAVRNAISIGGDSDTIAAIAGSIAEAYYGVPGELREQAENYLDDTASEILRDFEAAYPGK